MISIALDTATDRCSVAARNENKVAFRQLDGARRHAAAVLQLLDEVLAETNASAQQISQVFTADGPGSFTGLRVSATVAKALAWQRDTIWRTAPSLLLRAIGHCPPRGAVVLALSDALRGEVYAGCWQIMPGNSITQIHSSPRAMLPDALAEFGKVDVVVGSVPDALVSQIEAATQQSIIRRASALPDARMLFTLADVKNGTQLIDNPVTWEPNYGRPAEAQVVWERKHGRALPDSPVISR